VVTESANEGIRSLVQQSRRAEVAASSSIFQMLPVFCNHFFPFSETLFLSALAIAVPAGVFQS
jgi:hypothetical protein